MQLNGTPSLKSEFGDAGLVQLTKTLGNHSVKLFARCDSQRKVKAGCFRQLYGDQGVLGGMGGREKTGVVALLHVFTISSEDLGIGTGFREDLAQYGQVQPKCGA